MITEGSSDNTPCVVCITNMIEPYRVPLFNYLHDNTSMDLNVIALSMSEENRQWRVDEDSLRFNYVILPGVHRFDQNRFFSFHVNWGVWSTLRKFNPDFIINTGYVTVANWVSLVYCRVHDTKLVLWNGTTTTSTNRSRAAGGQKIVNRDSPLSGIREQLKRRIKQQFVQESDYFLTYGTEAAEYIESLGASSSNIESIINTVDMRWFRRQYLKQSTDESLDDIRSTYPDILLLYVGRLVRFKGLQQVLTALSHIDNEAVGLMIIGDGPAKQQFRDLSDELGLSNVYFKGYKQRSELPKYYTLADALVFPTFVDPWGLVVNEALATGLYVLSSELAGATRDLIDKPWKGASFDPSNIDEIVVSIKNTIQEIDQIRSMRGEISRMSTESYDIRHTARDLSKAIDNWK